MRFIRRLRAVAPGVRILAMSWSDTLEDRPRWRRRRIRPQDVPARTSWSTRVVATAGALRRVNPDGVPLC